MSALDRDYPWLPNERALKVTPDFEIKSNFHRKKKIQASKVGFSTFFRNAKSEKIYGQNPKRLARKIILGLIIT